MSPSGSYVGIFDSEAAGGTLPSHRTFRTVCSKHPGRSCPQTVPSATTGSHEHPFTAVSTVNEHQSSSTGRSCTGVIYQAQQQPQPQHTILCNLPFIHLPQQAHQNSSSSRIYMYMYRSRSSFHMLRHDQCRGYNHICTMMGHGHISFEPGVHSLTHSRT